MHSGGKARDENDPAIQADRPSLPASDEISSSGATASSTDEHQVAADAEARILFREFDGVIEGGAARHQGGAGEDSFAMSADDSFIYSSREAEIVGVEDQLFHLATEMAPWKRK